MKFKDDALYLNRGLSWLEFNQRVLDQAFDLENPLLERLKFLGIVSSNLDEFFEVHVAAIKQQCQHGGNKPLADGFFPEEEFKALSARIRKQLAVQYQCWKEMIAPALEQEKITFHHYSDLASAEQEYFKKYFEEFIFPMLTPLAVDPVHPFPQLPNLSLNVLVALQGLQGEEISTDLAVVPIPPTLPRLVPFPNESESEQCHFVFLESIIQHHVGALFYGVPVLGAHLFRITRNSNLTIDEEESDLLHAIEEELRHVHRHAPIRLEVHHSCPEFLSEKLLRLLHLQKNDLYVLPDILALKQLLPLAFEIDRPDLREKRFTPHTVLSLKEEADIFWHLRKGDILLHHPYDSFQTVLDFLGHAAEDPHTLAIKQTLYRTSHDSPLVASLITAAQNGKQVTVVIELKARFDEASNIKWARMMRDAGVNVIYGISGLKTHAKAMLVVRQEGEVIRRYVHLSTGNYHPTTARLYTDLGLLTADQRITDDVAAMFNMLTGVSRFPELQTLTLAPYNMKEKLFQLLNRESEHARCGRPAGVMIKMNALVEESMIMALYRASQMGVRIRLLIRGTCCLRPGILGVSDNIEVRSIVGRFLEHSRILRFENGGNPELFLSSADWMPRNLFRRVEISFPLLHPGVQAHIEEILEWFWKDNVKARIMDQDGNYHRLSSVSEPFNAQQAFLEDAQRRRLGEASSQLAAGSW
ncbi:MAG: polyphosphate kinase 1 [Chthoniobacterales bacterium]|nr:polyphosphate kinase 1 [Chthoniobacterales bacterium]